MLTRARAFLRRHQHLIGYLILVVGLCVALAVGFSALSGNRDRDRREQEQIAEQQKLAVEQNRQSAVNACLGYNKVVRGVTLIVEAQRHQILTSKQRTEEEKHAASRNLDLVLDSFPKLDCTADPIAFD